MARFQYNEAVELEYEHEPIIASANPIVGARYLTHVWLISNGNKYDMGAFDGKLDEVAVSLNFEDLIRSGQARQYGQQNTILRKELTPRRERGNVGTVSQRVSHSHMGSRSILNSTP